MNITHKWAMPSHETFSIKPIKEFIFHHIVNRKIIVDPFARHSKIGTITNDLNPKCETDYNLDGLDFLKVFVDNSVDCVLYDPPYSPRQLKECYDNIGKSLTFQQTSSRYWAELKDEISRIIKPGGLVLTFGWNSGGIGKTRGFERTDILLVAHGGMHHDTICVKEIYRGD